MIIRLTVHAMFGSGRHSGPSYLVYGMGCWEKGSFVGWVVMMASLGARSGQAETESRVVVRVGVIYRPSLRSAVSKRKRPNSVFW